MDEIADVTVTADDLDWLTEFTRAVVTDRLAACGNIAPSIRSIYRWDNAVQDEGEVLVTFHTRKALVPELIERVKRDHPPLRHTPGARPTSHRCQPRLPGLGPRRDARANLIIGPHI